MNNTVQNMNRNTMKARMKTFALRVMAMIDALPRKMATDVVARQLIRSATSVSANYRAALRGRSRKEFVAKLGIVEEEADESAHWIKLLIESGAISKEKVGALLDEASEITAMMVATIRSARQQKSERSLTSKANPKSEIRNPK